MKTMLDKCAVAGDITQAIDRRGAWSCAVTVIGGTENTAVKLQSCATADGTFEDFKTLIPSADASASQYKGFVVDISGAGNFIKVTGATMATCVLGDCDHDVKKVTIKAGEIPSGADLEDNKTATIDVSTYTEPVEVTPASGKDGMKKATVTLSNIPSGGGAILYAWRIANSGTPEVFNYCYMSADISPIDRDKASTTKILTGDTSAGEGVTGNLVHNTDTYTRVSDTEFEISWGDAGNTITLTYIRDSTKDLVLW